MHYKDRRPWQSKRPHSEEDLRFLSWLRDRGSLTARLQTRGAFAVQTLRQGLTVPTLDEAQVLGIRRGRLAWVREVALYCDGAPVVFAHTVLAYRPRGPLTGWLARLGNRSLGALLFANARFIRGALYCQRLDERHELFHPAIAALQRADVPPKVLWARRSRFRFGTQSVLVTEVFSPALSAS
jgi:chorismate lyase